MILKEEMTIATSARNNGIDLFRLIGAFFIMLLHAQYGELNAEYHEDIRLASRWALPFFFMATGFFLNKKIERNGGLYFKNIQANIIQLIFILIMAYLINMPFQQFFHLWFIRSLIFGYVFIWFIYFIKQEKFLPLISIVIALFCLFTDSYDQFLPRAFSFQYGRFLLCVPCMYLGMWISKRTFSKKDIPVMITLVIVGFMIQYLEAYMFYALFGYSRFEHQFLIGTVITVVPLFIFATVINVKENLLTLWGQKYSLFIYLYHPFVYILIYLMTERFFPANAQFLFMFSPIIGFVLILMLAILLDKFMKPIYDILNGKIPGMEKKKNVKLGY